MRAAELNLHVDFNYHWFSRVRIHIPVITHPSVIFHCGRERLQHAPRRMLDIRLLATP